ncbi:MAG: type II secretion system GspH family protein [Planctomycetaceae bacterium]|nr:type II secretion system GspH family protein [Planctomycetaceae bacterium]
MDTKRAFTLIEILTVVVIISILVAIVTVAVAAAMRSAHVARISVQMSQIEMALDRYKSEIGEYPPDLFDDEALVRHVKKRWPRLDLFRLQALLDTTWRLDAPSHEIRMQAQAGLIRYAISIGYGVIKDQNGIDRDINLRGVDESPFSPTGALALWLGGFPNSDGKLSGFYADPENPFTAGGPLDNKVFINLELGKNVRLIDYGAANIVPVVGTEIRNRFVPIIYFSGRDGGGPNAYNMVQRFAFRDFGLCVPYAELDNNPDNIKWHNPATYQLIHPGLDGIFGDADAAYLRFTASGSGIREADLDNLTNFSDYKELKSILP